MCNLFRRDTAFKVFVADLISTATVGKGNGKISFAFILEMYFFAGFLCNFGWDASLLQVAEQYRIGQRINTYLLVTGNLRFYPPLGNGRTNSTRKMPFYCFKRIGNILCPLKLHCQGDDISSLSGAKIIS